MADQDEEDRNPTAKLICVVCEKGDSKQRRIVKETLQEHVDHFKQCVYERVELGELDLLPLKKTLESINDWKSIRYHSECKGHLCNIMSSYNDKPFCKVCNLVLNSQGQYNAHIGGTSHSKKLREGLKIEAKKDEIKDSLDTSDPSKDIKSSIVSGETPRDKELGELCKVCNVFMNSDQVMKVHLLGRKHKNNAARLETETLNKEGGEKDQNKKITDNVSTVWCEVCDVTMTGAATAQLHFEGRKHKNKVAKLQDLPKSDTNPDEKASSEEKEDKNVNNPDEKASIPEKEDPWNPSGKASNPEKEDPWNPSGCDTPMRNKLENQKKTPIKQVYTASTMQELLQVFALRQSPDKEDSTTVSTETSADPMELWIRNNQVLCGACMVNITSKIFAVDHFQGAKHNRRVIATQEMSRKPEKWCQLCAVPLNSSNAANIHYHGEKHRAMAKMAAKFGSQLNSSASDTGLGQKRSAHNRWDQSPVGTGVKRRFPGPGENYNAEEHSEKGSQYFCSFCNCFVNSHVQMDLHRKSVRHLENVHAQAACNQSQDQQRHQANNYNRRQPDIPPLPPQTNIGEFSSLHVAKKFSSPEEW